MPRPSTTFDNTSAASFGYADHDASASATSSASALAGAFLRPSGSPGISVAGATKSRVGVPALRHAGDLIQRAVTRLGSRAPSTEQQSKIDGIDCIICVQIGLTRNCSLTARTSFRNAPCTKEYRKVNGVDKGIAVEITYW